MKHNNIFEPHFVYSFARFLSILLIAFATIFLTGTIFLVGYRSGYINGFSDNRVEPLLSETPQSTPQTKVVYVTPVPRQVVKWGGPELWEAVNKRRVEFGVGPMSVKEEICTIASIRLNYLLALGTLDGHKGFSSMPQDRPDLKWIFDKYNLSEFLVAGATSPKNAVDLWENTLGHKDLLSGGQYVWGCIYAQEGYGVAIAAY